MSSVQFNLLPDVKMSYVKAQRTKNLVVTIAFLVSAASVALLILMLFTVDVVQKKQMSDADNSVKTATTELKAIPNINRIVTVQNQLKSLVSLHQSKHISSRIFTYLPSLTPTNVHISQIALDFAANSMEINGTADSQHNINTFIDTIKFTTYKLNPTDAAKNAFSSVLETSFSISASGNSANFSLTANFDPALFSNNLNGQTPSLIVPKLTSTRSVLDDPANTLFNGSIPTKTKTQDGSQ